MATPLGASRARMAKAGVCGGTHWYVLQTKPKQEERADMNLRSWGIETWRPMLREPSRSVSGETVYRACPLFPNYWFARFELDSMFAKIRLTRGIQRVVGFGDCATPIDDAIIRLMQSRSGEDGFVRVVEPTRETPSKSSKARFAASLACSSGGGRRATAS
jgi:transcription antitermination factor NusG